MSAFFQTPQKAVAYPIDEAALLLPAQYRAIVEQPADCRRTLDSSFTLGKRNAR